MPGPAQLVATVEGVGDSAPFDLTIQKYAPAIAFDVVESPTGFLDTDGVSITSDAPAIGGKVILVFAYGLGNTDHDPPLGEAADGPQLANVSGTVGVFLRRVSEQAAVIAQAAAEIEAPVYFAGLTPSIANLYQVDFALPDGLEPGNYEVVLQISDEDGGNLARSAAAMLPVGAPPLTLNSVVNGASFLPGPIAPGTLVSLFAGGMRVSDNLGLFPSTKHEGLSITFNLEAAPLFHVIASQNQINLLAPNDLPGTGTANVVLATHDGLSEVLEVQLSEAAPGIFPVQVPGSDRVFAAATLANTAWLTIPDSVSTALGLPVDCEAAQVNPASYCGRPAKPGEAIQVFATGLGRATPGGDPAGDVLPSDQLPPSDSLYWTVMRPQVSIASLPAQLIYAGLSPGFAGLYQVNVVVPEAAPAGDEVLLEIRMPNGSSAAALIAVQP